MKKQHSDHPDYTEEPFQASLERERTLHRVVAVSAFATALCVLPIAQYFLLGGGAALPKNAESGEVAGASTEAPSTSVDSSTLQNIDASPEATPQTLVQCVNQKETDQADLTRFADGKKQAMLRDYDASVSGYRQALESLSANADQNERDALNGLIDAEYQKYLTNLSSVENAVNTSEEEIATRVCPAS